MIRKYFRWEGDLVFWDNVLRRQLSDCKVEDLMSLLELIYVTPSLWEGEDV